MIRKSCRAAGLVLALLLALAPLTVFAEGDIEDGALNLPCKSAILVEQTTGRVLYRQNPDEKLPIASVTKIMTLLLTMEALDAGAIALDDPVPISETAASMGGSQAYLEPGEVISLHEILKAVFVSSANDGAVALAEMISGSVDAFVAAMNDRATSLGMHDTVFLNPTGLDDSEEGTSTAHDVALMSVALLRHEKIYDYTKIWTDSIRGGAFGLANTNKLIRFYPGATGLKTGSTAKAKYCLSASAQRQGLKLCAVVLAGETSQDRFQSAKTMLDWGFANFASYQPNIRAAEPVRVWGGVKNRVEVTWESGDVLLPKKDAAGIEEVLTLPEELFAPLEQGQVVGSIQYKKGDTVFGETPILCAEAVPSLTFGSVFSRLLRVYFCGVCP